MLEHPDVNISLDFSSKRVDLISGEYDFVFRMGELVDSALIARKLCDLKVQVLASPNYLNKHDKPDHPSQPSEHKCISGSMRSWTFKQANGRSGEVNVKAELDCRNGRVMLHSALAGNGIIRVPEVYCSEQIEQQQLVPVFNDWFIEATPFYLVYVKDKHQPSRITAFKNFVLANFTQYLV